MHLRITHISDNLKPEIESQASSNSYIMRLYLCEDRSDYNHIQEPKFKYSLDMIFRVNSGKHNINSNNIG